MSYLAQLPDAAVLAAGHRAVRSPEAAAFDRELVRKIAWALFRRFSDETIRVPLFWGLKWTVRLGDLRPLWVVLFGPEVGDLELPPPDLPPAA